MGDDLSALWPAIYHQSISPIEDVIHLRNQFDIKGVPSILFIDKNGNEITGLRTLGFEKPEQFLIKMKKTLSK